MLLRLKQYSEFMFKRYETVLLSIGQNQTFENKLLYTKYLTTGQTTLFFNQSEPDRTFLEWTKDPNNPVIYQLKINHCLSLLVDSYLWSRLALNMDIDSFPEKSCFNLDLENFRIEESPDNRDGLTKIYFELCDSMHKHCPQNTRLRESLIRLIWAYLTAKDLTYQAHDLAGVSRIEYLRKLTKY